MPMTLYDLLSNERPAPPQEMAGGLTVMAAMLIFYATMIRTAMRLPHDFERLYKRAHWLGILAAAIGFPLLTIPAFIGVARLSKYRKLTNTHEAEHKAQ